MKKILAVVVAAFALTACGGGTSGPGEYQEFESVQEPTTENYQKGIYGDEFYTVDVDTHRCVVYNGDSKGGIFCYPRPS